MNKAEIRKRQVERELARARMIRDQIASEFLHQYQPDTSDGHDQLSFHKSPATIRIMLAGTGAGKTICTMSEVAAAVTGQSKALYWIGEKYKDPPVHVWIVKQSFPTNYKTDSVVKKLLEGDEFIDPETNQVVIHGPLIPDRFKPEYSRKANVIYLANGSTITLKSAEQDVLQFASDGIDLIVFDEPVGERIWRECTYRLVRRRGSRVMFALTPVGMTTGYLFDFMEMNDREMCEVFRMSTSKNRFLDHVRQRQVLSLLDEDEVETRDHGLPEAMSNLVYGEWDNWCRPFEIKPHWTRYVVHDPGRDNPAATLWGAVDEENNIYLYRCLYNKTKTPNIRVVVEDILRANEGDDIHEWYIDPFAGSFRIPNINDQTEEVQTILSMYQACGIPFNPGPRQDELAGRMKRMQTTKCYIDPNNKRFPMIYAFDVPEMKPLRKELKLYRMQKKQTREDVNETDQPHKKHDHLMYCMETMCALQLPFIRKRHAPIVAGSELTYIQRELMREYQEAGR